MKLQITFDYDPGVTERELGNWCNRITNKLGNDVIANLQTANPVDTGFSRGRWNFTRPTVPYGTGLISNDAHYILILDSGWSKQAAAGWIGASFQAAVRFLQ